MKIKRFCSLKREMREREMRNGESAAEKHGILWGKINRLAKRGGQSTPVASFWRKNGLFGNEESRSFAEYFASFKVSRVSSRKLGAVLWENHHYNLPLHNIHRGGTTRPPALRRRRRQPYKDKGSPSMYSSASRKQSDGCTRSIRSEWLSSYGSSMMKTPPYNSAGTPSSSTGLKGTAFDATYSFNTSAQLLKVLNHIRNLEEQHVSNLYLIKSLKKELYYARYQIKELLRDRNEKCGAVN